METGKITRATCPSCAHKVRVTLTKAPSHGGHANLPDGAEMVCLDFQEGCSEGTCPLAGVSGIVMGIRLARSGLRGDDWETVHARCQGCGQVVDLEVLDRIYGFCPVCGSTNRLLVLDLDDEGTVAITDEG